jgi:hypothetical protein
MPMQLFGLAGGEGDGDPRFPTISEISGASVYRRQHMPATNKNPLYLVRYKGAGGLGNSEHVRPKN